MLSRRTGPVVGLLAAVVFVACGDDGGGPVGSATPPAPTAAPTGPAAEPAVTPTPTISPTEDVRRIVVRSGQVEGGAPTIEAQVGDTVRFVVEADVADQVHVHGFDLHYDVVPGEETLVEFEAQFPGQFEIELEERGLLIAELEVR